MPFLYFTKFAKQLLHVWIEHLRMLSNSMPFLTKYVKVTQNIMYWPPSLLLWTLLLLVNFVLKFIHKENRSKKKPWNISSSRNRKMCFRELFCGWGCDKHQRQTNPTESQSPCLASCATAINYSFLIAMCFLAQYVRIYIALCACLDIYILQPPMYAYSAKIVKLLNSLKLRGHQESGRNIFPYSSIPSLWWIPQGQRKYQLSSALSRPWKDPRRQLRNKNSLVHRKFQKHLGIKVVEKKNQEPKKTSAQ